MTTSIRDQIIDILAADGDTAEHADRILAAVAGWMTTAELDFRLSLALSEAVPERFGYAAWEDSALTDAARAVVAEAAKALRPAEPAPDPEERPAVADRYAALAGGAL